MELRVLGLRTDKKKRVLGLRMFRFCLMQNNRVLS